jgi:hypothetical protein
MNSFTIYSSLIISVPWSQLVGNFASLPNDWCMYPETSSQPLCSRPMLPGYLFILASMKPVSRASATVGDVPRLRQGSSSLRTFLILAPLSIIIMVRASRPCDSHRVAGWDRSFPQVSRVKKTGDSVSSAIPNYPLRSPALFRIVGLSKPGQMPM